MPSFTPVLDAADFEDLGRTVAKYKYSSSAKVTLRRFKAHYGTPPDILAQTWELLRESKYVEEHPELMKRSLNPTYFMWGFLCLKVYSTWPCLANFLKVDEKTVKKWAMLYLEATAELDRQVVCTQPKNLS